VRFAPLVYNTYLPTVKRVEMEKNQEKSP
jgi:hypothetical protein